ncbi:uncharacterized protein [Montipora foliosa]|uniref:uncharacterized protein n=1 Tax=Montipora foliosa TaxID=591990 RepID=UPI0035F13BEC
MASLYSFSDLANLPDEGFIITEGGDGGHSTEPILPADAATYHTSGLNHTGANAAADSVYSGDGGAWQATEQSQIMGAGAYQANGLSDAVVGGAVQNQTSELIGGPNNGLWQSHTAERGGRMSDWHLADLTVDQTSERDYPSVMGLGAHHLSHNGHAASDNVFSVPSGEGAQQINGLPQNNEEEPVAEEANGSSDHRVERAWQACQMRLLDHPNGGNCRPYGTAVREALPFPIQEDVTCSPVQEQGDGYAGPQAPIQLPEVNLISPTVHRCSTGEIKQWKQQLTRSKPKKARKKNNARNSSFTFKITEVAQHRENETPIFTDAVYNDHQEKLFGIRIHPKGVGGGTGRHVALFIHLIKGDFDNSLVWPFAGTVTVSVLDQSDSRPRRDIIQIIEANPDVPAFQQPGETICRTGYGYERFALIEDFFGPRYVKADKLLLKIEFSG